MCFGVCRNWGCPYCAVKASGPLPSSLANLDQLQVLRLNGNWFNGTLPPEYAYGFPDLVEMRLDYNSLTVRGGLFPSRKNLDLAMGVQIWIYGAPALELQKMPGHVSFVISHKANGEVLG